MYAYSDLYFGAGSGVDTTTNTVPEHEEQEKYAQSPVKGTAATSIEKRNIFLGLAGLVALVFIVHKF